MARGDRIYPGDALMPHWMSNAYVYETWIQA